MKSNKSKSGKVTTSTTTAGNALLRAATAIAKGQSLGEFTWCQKRIHWTPSREGERFIAAIAKATGLSKAKAASQIVCDCLRYAVKDKTGLLASLKK